MRPRRPVVHHGAVALSSGSRYQALPALQSIPPVPALAGAITSACWRCSDQAARQTALSRFAGRDHAPDVRVMQQADVMVNPASTTRKGFGLPT